MADNIGDDITLLIGPEKTALAADAHILRKCSSVLNKMLGPNFREGQQCEIELPDDSAKAFEVALHITHFRFQELSAIGTLPPQTVRDLAVLSDKYDIPMLALHVVNYISRIEPVTLTTCCYMAEAAFIMKNQTLFRNITAMMVLKYVTSYQTLLEILGPHVPFKMLLQLEEQRSEFRRYLSEVLANFINYQARECDPYRCFFHRDLTKVLGSEAPDILGSVSTGYEILEDIMQRLTASFLAGELRNAEKSGMWAQFNCDPFEEHSATSAAVIGAFKEFVKDLQERAGLCLFCLQEPPTRATAARHLTHRAPPALDYT